MTDVVLERDRVWTPFHCKLCISEGSFHGRLLYEGQEVPTCLNHLEKRADGQPDLVGPTPLLVPARP